MPFLHLLIHFVRSVNILCELRKTSLAVKLNKETSLRPTVEFSATDVTLFL